MNDLKGRTLAMPKGYIITEKIEQDYPGINIIYTKNVEETLLSIITNKADATIAGLPVASYYLNQIGYDKLKIATNIKEYDMNLGMSVNIENDILLNILNKSINSITPSETNNIINKWVSVKYDHGIDMRIVRKISALSLILIVIIIIWNQTLKREINRRKGIEKELIKSNKKIYKQKSLVENINKEITDNIKYAKRIQYAILPPTNLVQKYLKDSFILYKPKDIVAGDFYWFETIDDNCVFAVADCTGHGVSGALISIICHNALNRSVREFKLTDPGQILDKVRELVIETFERSDLNVQDGMDIALCYLSKPNTKTGKVILHYAGANNPLWLIRDGELSETKANKEPIGNFDVIHPYTTHTFELDRGDVFYIFSDGYADQFGGIYEKKFKQRALKKLLVSVNTKLMNEQKIVINDVFENWKGTNDQIDDVCIMGVRV
jgi:serine phosphatase RsbU (regulator of sigma subunit)